MVRSSLYRTANGKNGTKYRHMNNSPLSVWITVTNRLVFVIRCTANTEKNWNRNDSETREEMIPVTASLMPMRVRSFARNASETRMETKYSKEHSSA